MSEGLNESSLGGKKEKLNKLQLQLNSSEFGVQVMMICCSDQNVEAKTNRGKMQISGTRKEKQIKSSPCQKLEKKVKNYDRLAVCW